MQCSHTSVRRLYIASIYITAEPLKCFRSLRPYSHMTNTSKTTLVALPSSFPHYIPFMIHLRVFVNIWIADHEIGRLSQLSQRRATAQIQAYLDWTTRFSLIPAQTVLRQPAIYRKTPVHSGADLQCIFI